MAKKEKKSKKTKKEDGNFFLEMLSTIIWALGIAFVLRTFLFQPFHIPSGSMLPGLRAGDYIITTKYTLGYGEHAASPLPFPVKNGRLFERKPERGDVLVFRVEELSKTYIKRLVGLPGDEVQMKDGHLILNGKRVQSKLQSKGFSITQQGRNVLGDTWLETFGNGNAHIVFDAGKNEKADNTKVYTVPAGHYFMLGDNRDGSLDSRFSIDDDGVENVPTEHLIGKAEFILLSVNEDFQLFKPWTWANMRGDRFFKAIK